MNNLDKELIKKDKATKYSYIIRLADEEEYFDKPEKHISVTLKKKPTLDQIKVLIDLYDKPYVRLDINQYDSEVYTLANVWETGEYRL